MSDETNATPADAPAQINETPTGSGAAVDQSVPAEKPPTQSFSPAGTDFTSVAAMQKSALDRLASLPGHPPFQMFIEEGEPNEARINSLKYAMERGIAAIGRMGEEAFIASYVDWWTAKGYWKGEDPFGGPLEPGSGT
jgi:hypothetical protein